MSATNRFLIASVRAAKRQKPQGVLPTEKEKHYRIPKLIWDFFCKTVFFLFVFLIIVAAVFVTGPMEKIGQFGEQNPGGNYIYFEPVYNGEEFFQIASDEEFKILILWIDSDLNEYSCEWTFASDAHGGCRDIEQFGFSVFYDKQGRMHISAGDLPMLLIIKKFNTTPCQ